MIFTISKKDKLSLLRIISSICTNLAAAWLFVVLGTPKEDVFRDIKVFLALTRPLILAILFVWLAYVFDKYSK